MARYREAPCTYYECKGVCAKGFADAEHKGRCQTCKKYLARKGYKPFGNRKRNEERRKYHEE